MVDGNNVIKLLRLPVNENRLQVLLPLVIETMEEVHLLADLDLPKELEPATYFKHLKEGWRSES